MIEIFGREHKIRAKENGLSVCISRKDSLDVIDIILEENLFKVRLKKIMGDTLLPQNFLYHTKPQSAKNKIQFERQCFLILEVINSRVRIKLDSPTLFTNLPKLQNKR